MNKYLSFLDIKSPFNNDGSSFWMGEQLREITLINWHPYIFVEK